MDSYKDQFDRGDWMNTDPPPPTKSTTPDPLTKSLEVALAKSATWFIENTMREHIMTELQLLAGMGKEIDRETAIQAIEHYQPGKFKVTVTFEE